MDPDSSCLKVHLGKRLGRRTVLCPTHELLGSEICVVSPVKMLRESAKMSKSKVNPVLDGLWPKGHSGRRHFSKCEFWTHPKGAKPELFGHNAQLEGKGKAWKRQRNCEVVGSIRRTLEILKENPIRKFKFGFPKWINDPSVSTKWGRTTRVTF